MTEMDARIEEQREFLVLEDNQMDGDPGDDFPLAETPSLRTGLTIDDIAHPAYMVNYNFELTWYNEPARRRILGFDVPPPGTESRNIFRLLPDATDVKSARRRGEFLRLYISLAKTRLSKAGVLGIVKGSDFDAARLIEELYEEPGGVTRRIVVDLSCTLDDGSGAVDAWRVYGIYFREGILIIHVPANEIDPNLLEFISRRNFVVRNLMLKQLPVFTSLAVLGADLQDSVRIRSELPPDEYFRLVKEIWSTMTPIFRKYYGTYGKHVGDGILYYFLPQPDSNYVSNAEACARELRQEMKSISKRWQLSKYWLGELGLNIRLHAGQEWLGTLQSAANVEHAVLRDTNKHAGSVGDFNGFNAVWAARNPGSKLMAKEKRRLIATSRSGAAAAGKISSRRHLRKGKRQSTPAWSATNSFAI